MQGTEPAMPQQQGQMRAVRFESDDPDAEFGK